MTTPPSPIAPTQAQIAATASLIFGEAAWLLMKSPMYKHLFLADLEWALLPALMANQFKRFHSDGVPIGFIAWAKVSAEVDARLAAGFPKLQPQDWTSGEQYWLVIVLGPEGKENVLIDEVMKGPLQGKSVKFRRMNADGVWEVVERRMK